MRDETEVARTMRFPKYVWDALSVDAKRCRRSMTSQLEALVVAYLELESVELDSVRLEAARMQIAGPAKRKVA